MSNPLNLSQDSELRDMRIETVTVYPRSISDQHCSIILPKKGYLSSDSRIVIPAVCVDNGYQYPVNAGVYALIQSATLSTESSGVIAQVDNGGELYSIMSNLEPAEKKDRIDSILHGVNFSFETGSGGKLDQDEANAEVFAGQYRLALPYIKKTANERVSGNLNQPPMMLDAQPEHKLKKFYKDTEGEAGTPEFSISLSQLFPGFFQKNFQIPLGLISDEVVLDIVFSNNGNLGNNDRAIFCPNQADFVPGKRSTVADHDGMFPYNEVGCIQRVGVTSQGIDPDTDTAFNVRASPTGGSGSGLVIEYDLVNHLVINVRVVDPGTGYSPNDHFTVPLATPLEFTVGNKFHDSTNVTYLHPYLNSGGSGYVVGDEYDVSMPAQINNEFSIKCTEIFDGHIIAISGLPVAANGITDGQICTINRAGNQTAMAIVTVAGGQITAATVITGGEGYDNGDCQFEADGHTSSDATIGVEGVGFVNGALKQCKLSSSLQNQQLVLPNYYYGQHAAIPQPYSVESQEDEAEINVLNKVVNCTCGTKTGISDCFVGDGLQVGEGDGTAWYIVLAVDAGLPTQLGRLGNGNAVAGDILIGFGSVDNFGCTIVTLTDGAQTLTPHGLGLDPINDYNRVAGQKINIQTDAVRLATDLVFYLDGKAEKDQETMMSKGLVIPYTQFRNVKSTLEGSTVGSTGGYTELSHKNEHSRLIGFSNEILRNLIFTMYPSGIQNNPEFPYHNKLRFNALMNKYCSRGSLAEDGIAFNVNVNSVPYYSSTLETDMRQWNELGKCFDSKLYVNKGLYQAWTQARQDANALVDLTEIDPSEQPGFTTNYSNVKSTPRYQINERKASIVNQTYMGVSQKYLRGMYHLNGVSFRMDNSNNIGNGIAVGSTPVDLQIAYTETTDPLFTGQSTLSVYGQVERIFILSKGRIMVTGATQ